MTGGPAGTAAVRPRRAKRPGKTRCGARDKVGAATVTADHTGGTMTRPAIPSRLPAGATPEGDGILVGNGPVRIDAYIDFLCPYCRQFELSSAAALAALVAAGEASIAYHPMNFLDDASTTNYSTRASAASACAADQGRPSMRTRSSSTSRPRVAPG